MNKLIKALKAAMMLDKFIPQAPVILIEDVTTFKILKENWHEKPTWLGVDTETIGLEEIDSYVTLGGIEIPHSITVIQYFDGLNNYIINVPKLYQNHINDEVFAYLREIHESKLTQKVFFNATFDIKMLWFAGIFTENAVCLMLGAKMCERSGDFNPSLKGVAKAWFGYDMDKSVRTSFLTDDVKLGILTEEQIAYASDDVEILAPIYRKVYQQLKQTGQVDGWSVVNFALQGTAFFEMGGVPVDLDELEQLVDIEDKEYQALLSKKSELGINYNLNSPKQIKELYKEKWGIELIKTDKAALKQFKDLNKYTCYIYEYRTHTRKVREKLRKSFLYRNYKNKYVPRDYDYAYSSIEFMYDSNNRKALSRRFGQLPTKIILNKLNKSVATAVKNAYLSNPHIARYANVVYDYCINRESKNFIEVEKHEMNHGGNFYLLTTNLNMLGAVTGRLSSSGDYKKANLQNVPSKDRACTRVPKGWVFCGADYSAIEAMIMAQVANATQNIKAINEGLDLHRFAASMVFKVDYDKVTPKQRKTVKAIVFLILYGGSVYGLAESLKITINEAQELMDLYFDTFPEYRQFLDLRVDEARYTNNIRLSYGNYRPLDIKSTSYASTIKSGIMRQSKNSIMQGNCANIIMHAMGLVAREIHKLGWLHIAIGGTPVHDEMGLMVPKEYAKQAAEIISKCMNKAAHTAMPDIMRNVEVDIARHWSKESYHKTLLKYAHGKANLADTEEVVVMCFGTHTTEYEFWNSNKENKEHIIEFFNRIEDAKYEEGTLDYRMLCKLI